MNKELLTIGICNIFLSGLIIGLGGLNIIPIMLSIFNLIIGLLILFNKLEKVQEK
jgi:hypothetical protein